MKEKRKSKKFWKSPGRVLLLIVLVVALVIVNGLFGNPISKQIAKSKALAYVDENYGDEDFVLKKIHYNFKVGGYSAYFEIPGSKDRHFSVEMSPWGRVVYEDYDNIAAGFNTAFRLNQSYHDLTDPVTSSFESEASKTFAFGSLAIGDEEDYPEAAQNIATLNEADLVPDYDTDIRKLGEKYGVIVMVVRDDTVTFERAKAYLLELKEKMDRAKIPFAAVDFSLDSIELTPGEDTGIYANAVLYEQIEDTEAFLNLLKDLHKRQMEIYEKADK